MADAEGESPGANAQGAVAHREQTPPRRGLRARWRAYTDSVVAKSRRITAFLHRRMTLLCAGWLALTLALASWRLAHPAAPLHHLRDAWPTLLSYTLVILAPIAGYWLARATARAPSAMVQPTIRIARFGRWKRLSRAAALAQPVFGPVGFMASLLVGMLLNVVVRAIEYFVSVPVMGPHAPDWGQAMFAWMTLDVVVTGFFYMVVFVMALRTVPLFPRMLLFAWGVDVMMQLLIAQRLAQVGGLPANVAEPLIVLLDGNIKKVLISAGVWLPYLLLSERVNVTYRHRTGA